MNNLAFDFILQRTGEREQENRTSQSEVSANCCDATASMGAMSLTDSRDTDNCIENVAEVLQATARYFSKSASSSGVDSMVEKANDTTVHKKLQEVLTGHFEKFGLNSLQSVVVFVLLNYFLVKKENREFESAKRLYEDHIALLKEKNSELTSRKPRKGSESAGETLESHECRSCDELRKSRDALSAQFTQLKKSYNEVCGWRKRES